MPIVPLYDNPAVVPTALATPKVTGVNLSKMYQNNAKSLGDALINFGGKALEQKKKDNAAEKKAPDPNKDNERCYPRRGYEREPSLEEEFSFRYVKEIESDFNKSRVMSVTHGLVNTLYELTVGEEKGYKNIRSRQTFDRGTGESLESEYIGLINERVADLSSTLGNDEQRFRFEAVASPLISAFQKSLVQHEAEAAIEMMVEDASAEISSMKRLGGLYYRESAALMGEADSPTMIDYALDQITESVKSLAALDAKPEAWVEAESRRHSAEFHREVIDAAMADQELALAEQHLERYGQTMDPRDAEELAHRVSIEKIRQGSIGRAAQLWEGFMSSQNSGALSKPELPSAEALIASVDHDLEIQQHPAWRESTLRLLEKRLNDEVATREKEESTTTLKICEALFENGGQLALLPSEMHAAIPENRIPAVRLFASSLAEGAREDPDAFARVLLSSREALGRLAPDTYYRALRPTMDDAHFESAQLIYQRARGEAVLGHELKLARLDRLPEIGRALGVLPPGADYTSEEVSRFGRFITQYEEALHAFETIDLEGKRGAKIREMYAVAESVIAREAGGVAIEALSRSTSPASPNAEEAS